MLQVISRSLDTVAARSLAAPSTMETPLVRMRPDTLRSISGRIRTSGVSIVEGGRQLRATTVSSDLDITTTLE